MRSTLSAEYCRPALSWIVCRASEFIRNRVMSHRDYFSRRRSSYTVRCPCLGMYRQFPVCRFGPKQCRVHVVCLYALHCGIGMGIGRFVVGSLSHAYNIIDIISHRLLRHFVTPYGPRANSRDYHLNLEIWRCEMKFSILISFINFKFLEKFQNFKLLMKFATLSQAPL